MARITAITHQSYETDIRGGNHQMISDQPIEKGGEDKGFTPRELLSASLASCTTITIRMYLNRKDWPIESIEVSVDDHSQDDDPHYRKFIKINGDVTEHQIKRMLLISKKCPIHKMLAESIEIRTEVI